LLYPTDVLVRHDDQGAPFVDGWWCQTLIEAPQVSLSHTGEICLAAVCSPEQAVGVDLEEVSRLKQPDLIVGSLAPEELRFVEGLQGAALTERVLRLWCAKEAVAKCLGTGLQGEPQAFQVVAADALCENLLVESAWGAVESHVHHSEGTIIAVAMQMLGDIKVDG